MIPQHLCKQIRSHYYFDAYVKEIIRYKKVIGQIPMYSAYAKDIVRNCLDLSPTFNEDIVDDIKSVLENNF